jgi:hypothetical protein
MIRSSFIATELPARLAGLPFVIAQGDQPSEQPSYAPAGNKGRP